MPIFRLALAVLESARPEGSIELLEKSSNLYSCPCGRGPPNLFTDCDVVSTVFYAGEYRGGACL